MHEAAFVADLAVVLGVAAVTSVLARLMHQPTILGYLFAGLIVGPYIPIPLFADAERVQSMADFGVILVMFAIGLEFSLRRLLKVLPISGFAGLVQISFMLWAGFTLGQALGWNTVESLFLGASIAISSTMVVSRLFDQFPTGSDVRQFVLGVLILQDVAAIVLIAAMTAVAAGGSVAPDQILSVTLQLVVVLVAMLAAGSLIIPKAIRIVVRLGNREILVVFSIGICFGMALLAEEFGYSVALGAFIAGVLVAESGQGQRVEHSIHPVRDLFAAIFFVSIGMTVNPEQALAHLPLSLVIFTVIVCGQFASVSVAGILSGRGLRTSLLAGLSLGQIGEFAFIIGGIGVVSGVARPALQPVLVTVAVLTAFTTPLMLRFSSRIVGFIDSRLPARLQHLLCLYQDWLERFYNRSPSDRQGRPVRRAIQALAFDAVSIGVVLGLAITETPRAAAWLSPRLQISQHYAEWVVDMAVFLVVAPLVFALVRNTLQLARLVGKSIMPDGGEPNAPVSIAVRALSVIVYLGVLLGVGAPLIALLRPLTGRAYGIAMLGTAVLGSIIYLWKKAGQVEREFQAGVEQIAHALASRLVQEEMPRALANPELLPGLDSVERLKIPEDAYCVGKSLAELELRPRTGATVVALRRADSKVFVPDGRERLQAGDVLAIVGGHEVVERASELLIQGPRGD